MIKKITILICVILSICMLSACNSEKETPSTPIQPPTESSGNVITTPAPTDPSEPDVPEQTTPGNNSVPSKIDLGKAGKANYELKDEFKIYNGVQEKLQGHITDAYSEGQDFVIAGDYLWRAPNHFYDEEDTEKWTAVCEAKDMKIVFGHYYCVALEDSEGNVTAMCGPKNEVSLPLQVKANEIKGHMFALNADSSLILFIKRDDRIYCQEYKLTGEISKLKPVRIETKDGEVLDVTDFELGSMAYIAQANGNLYFGDSGLYLDNFKGNEVMLKAEDRECVTNKSILCYSATVTLCYENLSDNHVYFISKKSGTSILDTAENEITTLSLPANYKVSDIDFIRDATFDCLVRFKDGRYYKFVYYNQYTEETKAFEDLIELNEFVSSSNVVDVDVLKSSLIAIFDDGYVYKVQNGSIW